jgi:hypothetical protein
MRKLDDTPRVAAELASCTFCKEKAERTTYIIWTEREKDEIKERSEPLSIFQYKMLSEYMNRWSRIGLDINIMFAGSQASL